MFSDQTAKSAHDGALHDPAEITRALRDRFASEMTRLEAQSGRLSLVRLLCFLISGALLTMAITQAAAWAWVATLLAAGAFAAAVVAQARIVDALEGARVRREIHERHARRLSGDYVEFPNRGERLWPAGHAYAWDLDLGGVGSLFQRIDVTHTVLGEHTLGEWLGRPATADVIRARQLAVRELASAVELRQELEAGALRAVGEGKLDGRPFREFAELPSYFEAHPLLTPTIFALPPLTLLSYLLGKVHVLPSPIWLLLVCIQLALLWRTAKPVRTAFNLATARQGVVEAFEHMLRVVERARFESPLLCELQQRMMVDGTPPSAHMRSLRSWVTSAELRQQFLFYIVVCPLTLWDLHVLRGLEAWNRRVGMRTIDWFAALGELEALCSLATLAFGEPDCSMPELVERGGALEAEALGHPLLAPEQRVENDVFLQGPGSALLVTGSNMAGKSTLLRALGLNVVLGLAGGPVCAKRLRLPPLRLRASMRAEDSLQRGASYFHAELQKLRTVVDTLEAQPPVLFLLDELLRGTNARARHLGAKAVLLHLLKRGAMGLVATHDVALAALEQQEPYRIGNVHFTDVVEDGEMRFDYRLRPGVVRTSNALRLLAMAGIDVPDQDVATDEAPAVAGSVTQSPKELS